MKIMLGDATSHLEDLKSRISNIEASLYNRSIEVVDLVNFIKQSFEEERSDLELKISQQEIAHKEAIEKLEDKIRERAVSSAYLHLSLVYGTAVQQLLTCRFNQHLFVSQPAKLCQLNHNDIKDWIVPDAAELINLRCFLQEWNLFSASWYRKVCYGVLNLSDQECLEHFIHEGLMNGIDPHPIFSSRCLLEQGFGSPTRPIICDFAKQMPLISPHLLFDCLFYLAQNPDVMSTEIHPLKHYIKYGYQELRQPHVCFEPKWYSMQRGAIEGDLLSDYVSNASSHWISPNPFFDATYYYGHQPALVREQINPLMHYLAEGERLGKQPSANFDPTYYLSRNPDVAKAAEPSLKHFLEYGDSEFRVGHPLFDPQYYTSKAQEYFTKIERPHRHYLVEGAKHFIPPSRDLDLNYEFEKNDPPVKVPICTIEELMTEKYHNIFNQHKVISVAKRTELPEIEGKSVKFAGLLNYIRSSYGESTAKEFEVLLQFLADMESNSQDKFHTRSQVVEQVIRSSSNNGNASERPLVSVIIPVHNQIDYTLACLAVLLKRNENYSYEVIVADDASNDGTADLRFENSSFVKLIRQTENLGFIRNCNAAAKTARGEYFIFLNNDTLPLPGWIDAMIDLCTKDPTIGLVGAKLINTDGTLQEAGGIIWSDGSAWNFGRGDSVRSSVYNYVKDIDYVSGAAIAIRRTVWEKLDGFDLIYCPAYCEDSDFAFRVREAGWRTVYQPKSEVVHHEGKSHGRDVKIGLKSYQVRNNSLLRMRWKDKLHSEHFLPGQQVFVAKDRSRFRPHLLLIDHYVPQWDKDAGSRTIYNFILALVKAGIHVTFWPDNLIRGEKYGEALQQLGVEVVYGGEFHNNFQAWLKERSAWFDYVLLSRPHIANRYINDVLSQASAKIIYYGHDLHWKRLLQDHEATGVPDLATVRKMQNLEQRIALQSDLVLYPSREECEDVKNKLPPHKVVRDVPAWFFEKSLIEQSRSTINARISRETATLLFVGGFVHGPNLDAMNWFLDSVYPLLEKSGLELSVLIAGSNAPEILKRRASARVSIIGQVSDDELRRLYRKADVAIAPLRFGAGVKGKVIEALFHAVPVVSTSIGMQGIPDPAQISYLGDTAEDFAAMVGKALKDRSLSAKKSNLGLDFLSENYTAEKFINIISEIIRDLK